MDVIERLQEIFNQAAEFAEGSARTTVLEEAIRIADESQELGLQFQVRMIFVHEAFTSGDADKMLVALSWCTNVADRNPHEFPELDLVEAHTLALAYVTSFASISQEQINRLLDDFERRCKQCNVGMRVVYRYRCFSAMWMGHAQLADKYFEQMNKYPSDEFCPAGPWHDLFRSDYFIQRQRLEDACATAQYVLDASDDSDGAYLWLGSFMLLPLIRLGRFAEAEKHARRAYPMVRSNPKYIEVIGLNISALAALNLENDALPIMERHIGWAAAASSVRARLEFYVGAMMICIRLINAGNGEKRVRTPDAVKLRDDSPPTVQALHSWLQGEVQELVRRFNERNGTEYFTELVESRLAMVAG
ncbi:MAG: tetratricopeptide (TPR) repeat protein [Pirellulaceae bacterium]|jgi:tetratricopeptide (TPR) repeat protein